MKENTLRRPGGQLEVNADGLLASHSSIHYLGPAQIDAEAGQQKLSPVLPGGVFCAQVPRVGARPPA
jgi:hypothetical protein